MSQPMPDLVDPWRLAALGKRFSGRVPLAKFPRLGALLLSQEGDVVFELAFDQDQQGHSCVRGRVEATLRLQCQRCLQPVDFAATAEICLAMIETLGEMALLPEQYDPLLVETGDIKPLDLLEDELLLVLPQVPMHPEGACSTFSTDNGRCDEPGVADSRRQNPFAALAKLKRN